VIELTEPVKKLVSVVSQSVYDTGIVVSATHCQEGQGDNLYVIKQGNVEFSNEVTHVRSKKTNKTKKHQNPKKTRKTKHNKIKLKHNVSIRIKKRKH
jgi:nickel-dependent lactate racemase